MLEAMHGCAVGEQGAQELQGVGDNAEYTEDTENSRGRGWWHCSH